MVTKLIIKPPTKNSALPIYDTYKIWGFLASNLILKVDFRNFEASYQCLMHVVVQSQLNFQISLK